MSDTTHDTAKLNQAAAHDTGFYDPTIHDNQIVTLYETLADATRARDALQQAGFPGSSMEVLARSDAATTGPAEPTAEPREEGFWAGLKSLFIAEEDRTTFNTAVARGHAMLVVTPDAAMDRHRLIGALEATQPLDFDAKLEEWRQAGYDTTGAAAGTPASNRATLGHAVDAGLALQERPVEAGMEQPRMGYREQPEGASRARSYIATRAPVGTP